VFLINNPFAELSFIFILVFVIATVMRLLRQPFIVGFILTGILFSPQLLGIEHIDSVVVLSAQLGVALLLFIAGLHLNPYYLKTDGKAIILSGIGQIVGTGILAYLISLALGFTPIVSIYLAIALTLSSTIITLKLLADRKLTSRLYARLSIGILLIQDVFVAIALVVLNALQNQTSSVTELLLSNLAWLIIVFVPVIILQRYVLPKILPKIAKVQEYLFIFVIAWMLVFATIFEFAGFSLEVGALLAGVILASTIFATEISAKIKPLRDFFLIIFFIHLGSNITITSFDGIWVPVLVFSGFVLIVKPIIVTICLGLLGFRSKVSARTALNLSHISEFSLILMALGFSAGVIDQQVSVIITLVAVVTIAVSTYLITYDEWIIEKLAPLLHHTERKWRVRKDEQTKPKFNPEILLIGARQGGKYIIDALSGSQKNLLVIDYDPEVINKLQRDKIPCLFGDLDNLNDIEGLHFEEIEFIISTVQDLEANLTGLHFFNKNFPQAKYISYAADDKDALQLYEHGATYAIVPHHVGGQFVSTLIENYNESPEAFLEDRLTHLRTLSNKIYGH